MPRAKFRVATTWPQQQDVAGRNKSPAMTAVGQFQRKFCSLARGTHTSAGSAKRKHRVDAQATTVICFGEMEELSPLVLAEGL